MLNILHVCVCRSLDRLFWQGGDELGVGISVLWRGLCCREPALGSHPCSAGRENPGKNYTMSFFFSPFCASRRGSQPGCARSRACLRGRPGGTRCARALQGGTASLPRHLHLLLPRVPATLDPATSDAVDPPASKGSPRLLGAGKSSKREGGKGPGGDASSAATPHEDRPQQHNPPPLGFNPSSLPVLCCEVTTCFLVDEASPSYL